MKIIDFEAHFRLPDYVKFLEGKQILGEVSALQDALLDLGEGRLRGMDASGIDMQVLMLGGPQPQQLDTSDAVTWSRKINDQLAAVVKKYPKRFIGLAALALQSPQEAAEELERAITKLGLKGLYIQSHVRNEYLDNRKYWAVFEKAEKLDIPIYIHPTTPSTAILKPYADYGYALSGPALGYAADVALHIMRLIYSGLFDEYPKLKIVLGHLGEGLPYWLSRLDFFWQKEWVKKRPAIKKRPSDYIKTNFTVTTSGMCFQPAFMCAYLALGIDKIAFAVDYPYEKNNEAVQFIKEVPICNSDKEKICHLNAEKLLKL